MTTRNGKIARLPAHIREQLNQRLHDGESGSSLVDWLNSLAEVQAVLAASFHGQPISEQNLSQWKQGGFEDWLAQQEVLGAVRQTIEDAAQIMDTVPGSLADPMAQLLTARLSLALAKLKPQGENGESNGAVLHALCEDLVELRRGDQNAERLRIERERLAMERERLEMDRQHEQLRTVCQFQEWAQQDAIKMQICGRGSNEAKINAMGKLMFGEHWDNFKRAADMAQNPDHQDEDTPSLSPSDSPSAIGPDGQHPSGCDPQTESK